MISITGEKEPLFVLHTVNTTYAMKVLPSGHIEHLYYGRKIRTENADGLSEHLEFPAGCTAVPSKEHGNFTLEDVRLEMSSYGKGDVRNPFIVIRNSDGSSTSDFRYESYTKSNGRSVSDEGEGSLPRSYGEDAEILTITLIDKENSLKLDLVYTVFPSCDVITRYSVLKNTSDSAIVIGKIMSTQIDFDPGDYVFTTFTGAWAREMKKTDMPVSAAKLVNSAVTGSSSSRANPFVMISRKGTTEDYGDCWGFNLVYSSNHCETVERSPHGKVRFLSGINPDGFSWKLAAGKSFESPEAVMTFSSSGFNGQSGNMHVFVSNHILRGQWKSKLRPVLLNSWEAAYFDINEDKLLKLAEKAKSVGIELFVMDDGWFGKRNNDSCSLGDWYPNPEKLPNGLKGLCDKIRALGLEFGIWVEPEMVNEDSDLFRAHPDWAIRIPGKHHSLGRNQMILDLTRKDVQDYIIDAMRNVFSSAEISYVKWDMNRIFTDVYSQALPADRQGEVFHRYILGVYRVMRTLTNEFPHILFEGCASGGNRFDLSILSFFPQIWASDDTDAVARVETQNGYSYGYPMSCVTAHVSDVPNHQTLRSTPLETRFNVACFGTLGYECNLCNMSDDDVVAIKAQIAFYKEHRETMQYGRFYRGCSMNDSSEGLSALDPLPGNDIAWTVVSPDRKKAVAMTMRLLTHPNTKWRIIRPKGLDEETKYQIKGRVVTFEPVAHFGKLHSEPEEHIMYGDAIMHAGVHLKNSFAGTGYNENVCYYPDFGSRIYTIEAL